MKKYLPYVAVALALVILGVAYLKPPIRLGVSSAVSTATQYHDIELNNQDNIGNASLYVNGTKYTDSSGNWLGNILQTGATQNAVLNNVVFGSAGYSNTFTTTSTVSSSSFCGVTSVLVQNTTATITLTLPNASTTYTACHATVGSWSLQVIENDSTNTAIITPGTGMTVRTAVTTSTSVLATQTSTVPATSTMYVAGLYTGTSTMTLFETLYH